MIKRKKQTPQRRSPSPGQSAQVFSYRASRSSPEVSRARYEGPAPDQTPRTSFFRHVPTVVAVVVILGSLAYASLLSNRPRIVISASTTGQALQRESSVYEEFIENELSRSISSRSKLTFDSRPIVAALQRQYPEVATAIITVPLINQRPVVQIAVSSPAFILATTSGAYYISERGVPLARTTEVATQIEGVMTVSDGSGVGVEIGKQILPVTTVTFIRDAIAYSSLANLPLSVITLPLEANELQLQQTGKSYVVRLNTRGDARTQIGTLLAVQRRLTDNREEPREYIDVRVEDRAYYP